MKIIACRNSLELTVREFYSLLTGFITPTPVCSKERKKNLINMPFPTNVLWCHFSFLLIYFAISAKGFLLRS